jgi:putative addiction module killer protein
MLHSVSNGSSNLVVNRLLLLEVEATPKHLIDYETTDGALPIRKWLDDLDSAVVARIEARLKRVAFGNLGDVKGVGEGVSELRMTFGSGYRVYFGQHGNDLIILLCGGSKGSQSSDIEKAHEFWIDWKRRNNV